MRVLWLLPIRARKLKGCAVTGYQIDGGLRRMLWLKPATLSHSFKVTMFTPLRFFVRTYRLSLPKAAGPAERLAIRLGAAAHIVAQIARREGRRIYAFTRPGDRQAQDFALSSAANGPAARPGHRAL
jgi:propanol-preferring alcohol dehydrogenase